MDRSQEKTSLVILFADITRSTQIYETVGNEAAQKLVGDCLSHLSKVTVQHQGTVIKTIGDEVMCTFPSADLALEAAKAMHQTLEQLPVAIPAGLMPPSVRIGFHQGSVVREGDDVFGDAVNVAARMVALAKPRQIITTEQTVQALTSEAQAMVRCIDKTTVKGKRVELNIYEAIWEQLDVTVMAQSILGSMVAQSRLTLRFADQVLELDQGRPVAHMGRHESNEIVVDEVFASRSHCRVEYRRGKFVLVDQSTNGTYVLVEGQESTLLRRDEMPLQGSGSISLGRPLEPDSPTVIHFSHES